MLPSDPPFEPCIRTLETNRLSIRIDTLNDYVRMFRTGDDETLMQYFGITNEEELMRQKNKIIGGLTTYRTSVIFFHLIERMLGRVIGNVAFHNWYPIHRRSEIGYMMTRDEERNKGYMSEAIAAIIAFGFREMDLNRMEAFVHPENDASRKLVQRVGFQQEGWLKEHFCHEGVTGDSLVFGLLRADYYAAKAPDTVT